MRRSTFRTLPAGLLAIVLALPPVTAVPAVAATAEKALRAAWVGRWVVLRSEVLSDCDERYTNNRMRGPLPSSNGLHRFAAGELGRIDNVNLQRARLDLLVQLVEPLRVELRDGPFQLYEHRQCRAELEVPAPRSTVRRGEVERLQEILRGLLESHDGSQTAVASALWNRRRVEPLPEDYAERLAAYHAWKEEQLLLALRDRLAEALDQAGDVAAGAARGTAYAQGLARGAREVDRDRLYSNSCEELPAARFSPRRGQPPKDLEDDQERQWRDGFEDGQLLIFEIAVARQIERCLP